MKASLTLFMFILSLSECHPQGLVPFQRNELWGYKDAQGHIRIEAQYDYAVKFVYNYGIVARNDSLGAIDSNNKIVIPIKYQFLRPLDSTEFMFGYRARYFGEYYRGVITNDQKTKIPPLYSYLTKRSGCYAVEKRQDSVIGKTSSGNLRSVRTFYGLLDSNGKVLIPCEFDYLSWMNDSLLVLTKENSRALFNKKGRQLSEFYMVIGSINTAGLCKVRKGEKYGFISPDGKIAIPLKFDFCEEFENGFAIVKEKDKWGAIDKNGKIMIQIKYQYEDVKNMLKHAGTDQ